MKNLALWVCLINFSFVFTSRAGPASLTETPSSQKASQVTSTLWAPPVNTIAFGVRYLNAAERKEAQSDVLTFLQSVTQTNRPLWIAPPKFQRVSYFLYDSDRRPVPYLGSYHPANAVYENLTEIPKNVHNVYAGIIMFPEELPIPYDRATLTNMFDIKQAGDYKLVVRGQIMRSQKDGRLKIFAFPAISLPIHVDESSITK